MFVSSREDMLVPPLEPLTKYNFSFACQTTRISLLVHITVERDLQLRILIVDIEQHQMNVVGTVTKNNRACAQLLQQTMVPRVAFADLVADVIADMARPLQLEPHASFSAQVMARLRALEWASRELFSAEHVEPRRDQSATDAGGDRGDDRNAGCRSI
jgi:hypothetical protein